MMVPEGMSVGIVMGIVMGIVVAEVVVVVMEVVVVMVVKAEGSSGGGWRGLWGDSCADGGWMDVEGPCEIPIVHCILHYWPLANFHIR